MTFAPQPHVIGLLKDPQEFGFPGDDRVAAKALSALGGRVADQPEAWSADMPTDPGVVFDAQTRLLVAVLRAQLPQSACPAGN